MKKIFFLKYLNFPQFMVLFIYIKIILELEMKKKSPIYNYYNINPDSSAYMVEISLDNYAELFNGWDASPLKRRDLEPELLHYIEQCGTEIPLKYDVELYLYLSEKYKDEEKEARSKLGIINNFNIVLFFIKKSLEKIYRQIFANILLSIVFLVAANLLKSNFQIETLFPSIAVEGLYIGGWVLLWEAFSLFFFDSYEIRQRKKIFIRFKEMKIYFTYLDEKNEPINVFKNNQNE